MKRKRMEGLIIFFCGLICIGAGLFVYFSAHTIYPDSESSRIMDLNRLLKTFGKTGTALLFAMPGFLMLYYGLKQFRKN